MSVAIVGDSYVYRLGNYLRAAHVDALDIHECFHTARYFGLRGGSVFGRDHVQPLIDRALAVPDLRVLYMHVGSNDLCSFSVDPLRLARGIVSLARYALCAREDLVVIVGQILTRSHHSDAFSARRVHVTNSELIRLVHCENSQRLSAAMLDGLCQPSPLIFCDDGVHLSHLGQRKFYRGIRGAVLRALRYAADPSYPSPTPALRP